MAKKIEEKYQELSEILSLKDADLRAIGKEAQSKGTNTLVVSDNVFKFLENYGFNTIDLGKNVAPETIVEKTVELHAPFVGLSALMTTTVPAMEETIKLLRKQAPWCKIVVGGAVLTKEYADTIGADKYAKDAMETVRYAKDICSLDR